MALIVLDGYIQDGQLQVTLPPSLPSGQVRVMVEVDRDLPLSAETWTDEELAELLTIEPLTGAEIVAAGLTGVWADKGINDSVAWVEAQRSKRRANFTW